MIQCRMIWFCIVFALASIQFLCLYFLHKNNWLFADGDSAERSSVVIPEAHLGALAVCPPIDTEHMKESLVCVQKKCSPPENNTLQGLGLDPLETVIISMPVIPSFGRMEYYKYRIDFPEEDAHLNLTARLSNNMDLAVQNANDKSSIPDQGFLQPRPITERLLRRIVAKLLHAGVLDPSKSIVNTGSWIGDNALPWALMLEKLRPENPGKIIAIDPSERFIYDMVDLANVNGVGNLCAQIAVLSSKVTKVGTVGMSTEHIGVSTEDQLKDSEWKKKRIDSWLNAVPLDSLNLQNLSLLHLDVEGHEGEVLEGAMSTIESSRPVIITEGFNIWPNPTDENDKQVSNILTELRYEFANTIPEYCGLKTTARNRIWWPDEKTKDAAMEIIGKELERTIVPWMSKELPELE